MKLKTLPAFLIFTLMFFSINSNAGIIVGGTRVIYNADSRETTLSVKNPDNHPYLIQAWMDADGPDGKIKTGNKPPFVVTPPLFRLDEAGENIIRIICSGGDFATDRESIFWMNVKSIPASSKHDKNVLQISVKTRIKLFYRPEGLKSLDEEDMSEVIFKRHSDRLEVVNKTPNYISFFNLKVGDALVDTTNNMVPPKGSSIYKLPSSIKGNNISWQYINDYGGSSSVKQAIME